jgi:hypothetical protein
MKQPARGRGAKKHVILFRAANRERRIGQRCPSGNGPRSIAAEARRRSEICSRSCCAAAGLGERARDQIAAFCDPIKPPRTPRDRDAPRATRHMTRLPYLDIFWLSVDAVFDMLVVNISSSPDHRTKQGREAIPSASYGASRSASLNWSALRSR